MLRACRLSLGQRRDMARLRPRNSHHDNLTWGSTVVVVLFLCLFTYGCRWSLLSHFAKVSVAVIIAVQRGLSGCRLRFCFGQLGAKCSDKEMHHDALESGVWCACECGHIA